jgi:hypothetical protein
MHLPGCPCSGPEPRERSFGLLQLDSTLAHPQAAEHKLDESPRLILLRLELPARD